MDIIKEYIIFYTIIKGKVPKKNHIMENITQIILDRNLENKLQFIKSPLNPNNIDILYIIKNGEVYLKNYFNKIVESLNNFVNIRFYLYENNSTDSTKKLLSKLDNQSFNIKSEDIKNNTNKKYFRYKNILNARNKLLKFYKNNILLEKNVINLKSQWIVLADIDIIYNYKTIEKLFENINLYPEGVMFCANTDYISKNNIQNKYYDILALNYGKYFNLYGHNYMKMNNLLYKNDITEIETGFGGLAIIRKDVYLKNFLENKIPNCAKQFNAFKQNFICEHWNSCYNIRKHGKIYFVKDAKALWIEEKYYKNFDLINNYINKLELL